MDRTADLDSALSFVMGRIAAQAKLSGEPLSDQQLLLLKYLPSSAQTTWDPEIPIPVPRNIDLERVCELGKAAYQHDRQVDPTSLDWEFTFAVFMLNRHPMAGGYRIKRWPLQRRDRAQDCWFGRKIRPPSVGGLL